MYAAESILWAWSRGKASHRFSMMCVTCPRLRPLSQSTEGDSCSGNEASVASSRRGYARNTTSMATKGGRSDRERIQKQGWGFNTLWVRHRFQEGWTRRGIGVCLRRMTLVAGLCFVFLDISDFFVSVLVLHVFGGTNARLIDGILRCLGLFFNDCCR